VKSESKTIKLSFTTRKEPVVNWTAEEVRKLRYRLGWSQAELARSLNLEIAVLSNIEAGRSDLPEEFRSALLRIFNQAESNADRAQRRPIADVIMKDRGLSQIHDFDVATSIENKIKN
jgi:transcriptional regulator with XRE-family HTH domain